MILLGIHSSRFCLQLPIRARQGHSGAPALPPRGGEQDRMAFLARHILLPIESSLSSSPRESPFQTDTPPCVSHSAQSVSAIRWQMLCWG